MTETPKLDPATFDLDSWLEGAQRLRATVTMYARRDLMGEIDEIVAELEPLDEKLRDEDGPEQSMAEAGVDASRAEELRSRLGALWAEYEASGVDFELEELPSDDYDEIVVKIEQEYPTPAFDAPEAEQLRVAAMRNELSAKLTLIGCIKAVGPHGQPRTPVTLTLETLKKITSRFGVTQISELVSTARSLTLENRVDAPFSQRVSRVLAASTSE